MSRALAERQTSGGPLIDLTLSNPTRAGLTYPEDVWEALAGPLWHDYAPAPLGLHAARDAVRRYYAERGAVLEPEQVVLTASTSEAYSFLFKLLADPGDQVLVPRPTYPLLDYLGGLEGVQLTPYPLRRAATGWQVDVDRLAAAIGNRTRAVVLVSPHNPTGSYVSVEDRRALESLAAECGLALIADEVFADYALVSDSHVPKSFASSGSVLTFTLSGLSKVLGLPQLKLSWIVAGGPEPVRSGALARLEVIADTYLSVSTGMQRVLPDLLALRGAIQRSITERISRNLSLLREAAADVAGTDLLEPEGGWYAVLEIARDADAFAMSLLHDEGVLLYPGHFYDFPFDRYLVISLLPADFESSLLPLRKHLRQI